jgi:serine/threonine protein kinase
MNAQGDIVALKCIDLDSNAFSADKFLETEVSVLSEIHHPNLASFISLAVHRKMVIIVLEYVAGGTLRTVIGSYKQLLPRAAAKRFALDILNGLQYLNEHSVVHGDIKPENVLIGSDSVCKLTDFGSAVERKIAEHAPAPREDGDGPDLRGTAPYMAPEVAAGEMPTAASDVWSFGVLLHELITGELPWQHESGPGGAARSQIKLIQGLGADADSPHALRPRISIADAGAGEKGLAIELLQSCFKEDPGARPTAMQIMTFGYLL